MASKAPSLFRAALQQPLRRATTIPPLLQQSSRPAAKVSPSSTTTVSLLARRAAHSIPRPPPRSATYVKPEAEAQARTSGEEATSEGVRPPMNPAYYQLSFTCVPCGHRSHHNVSKQGYHMGSTLITCPGCRNRHVISDHLNIFGDRKITVEDLMREKGQLVKRGSLGEDGDIEFWPEETSACSSDGSKEQ